MKAISLSKWTPDGYDERYCMYRFVNRSSRSVDEYLLVSSAKLLDEGGKLYSYLNPTTDRVEANTELERAKSRLKFYNVELDSRTSAL
jgi:hypothetical protein